jgi:hypothetical protein
MFSVKFNIFGHLDPPFLAPGYSFFQVHQMYHRTTKWCTNANERHNALNSSELQAYENLQAILLFAFIKQHHAHQLLLAAIAIDLQDNDKDDSLFMLCLLNYQSKTSMVRVLLHFFFMTIFPEQRVPCHLYHCTHQTFASLDPSWCYCYTRFTNHQLQLLFDLLNPPLCFIIHNGKCHCSSEETFAITFVKLATGATNLGLQDLFMEKNDQPISNIYTTTPSVCWNQTHQVYFTPLVSSNGKITSQLSLALLSIS